MEIQPPEWRLAAERCPCCDNNGELIFRACPDCGDIVLICNEIGTIFAIENRRRGQDINQDHCHKCAAREYRDFPPRRIRGNQGSRI